MRTHRMLPAFLLAAGLVLLGLAPGGAAVPATLDDPTTAPGTAPTSEVAPATTAGSPYCYHV